jgi:hypothetical protein
VTKFEVKEMNQRQETIPAVLARCHGSSVAFRLLLCIVAFQAKAAPDAFTVASGSVISAGGTVLCQVVGPFNTAPSSSNCTQNFPNTGSGSYSAGASYGLLGATALASVGTVALPNQGGTAAGEAEFRDAFTASVSSCSGSCLFTGTMVVTALLEGGAYALNPNSSASGNLSLSLINASNPSQLNDQESASIMTTGTGNGGACGIESGDLLDGFSATGACLVTARVAYSAGDKVYLTGILQALAGTSPYQDPTTGAISNGLAHADFGNTAMITSIGLLDSSGNPVSNAIFTSASGTSYPAPVPVPAALWLLGSGLLGLIGVGRRAAT